VGKKIGGIIRKNILLIIALLLLLARLLPAAETPGSAKGHKSDKDPDTLRVEDLGFSGNETQSDPKYQRDLQVRSDMLQIHQRLGIITAVPMTAEFVLGIATAGNVANGSTDTGLHAVLGISTVALYGTTALFAILAPKPKGLKPSGNTEVHADLAWIHAPLMAAVPIVGALANDRVQNHQPLGDLGTIHFVLAATLLASYLTSLTVITF
jgi:hypothetical protein